ncbi:peptidase [Mizugakiibacter sediminis]|uniref:Acyl-peptide hydrolase n=1 Tax=Mizugakiibacter sediminis TaxID=1475481 RepID=A0A0K8QQL8_9GAMM|nr:S9 family peptidase [Mizugakiibacter sediminis]GAP66672.1 peptidase [Mizugakiibacter sediminis]
MRPTLLLTALLAAAGTFAAPAAPAADAAPDDRILQPMDVFRLEWADAPQLSPDGRYVVYERNRFDVMKDRKRTSLWLVDAEGRVQRPLTDGETDAGDTAWSPDGRRLAYVARTEGKAQIFVRWMDSGATAPITHLTESPHDLRWSPDGKWIAFTMRVPAEETPLAKLPAAPKGAQWAEPAKLIDRVIYRIDGGGYVDPGYTHVFVVAADGGAARQVTQGKHDFRGAPAWTRDGKALIVSANLDERWEYEPLESDLYRVDVDSGALTRLTDRKGPDRSPVLSPDGTRVAYLGFDDHGHPYQPSHLYVLDLKTGKRSALTENVDLDLEDPAWDGNRGLYVHYDDHGVTKVGWVGAGGGKVEVVTDDFGGTAMGRPYGGGAMSAAAGKVAYTRGTAYRPADVAVVARGGKPRVLTDLNANLLDHKRLGKVEAIDVKSSADGRNVQAWIVTPPDFDPAKKYPLLLEIHGGPFANYGPRFAPETQLYAAHGYVVVYANPRGSTSYGSEFANLIENAYPSRDYDDLMSVVDAVIARGAIDTGNLFVTGGSGGGVLTAWIVGHTDRFRAAVVAKPVINWYSFVLTSDFYTLFSRYWFPGVPWENAEHYLKRSPISYVGNVKTPTMLITGDADHRTPSSEAEQFYQALKLRQVDTAMLRIPGASHEINTRPSNMLDQVLYTIGWFEKHRAGS